MTEKDWKLSWKAVGSQEIDVFWFYNVELAAIRKLCKCNYLQIRHSDVKVRIRSNPGHILTLSTIQNLLFFHKNSKQWVFTIGEIGRFVPQLRRTWFRTISPSNRDKNRPISSVLFRYFLRFFNFSSSRLILKRLRSFHPRSLWWWIRGSSHFHQSEGVQNDEMSWTDIFELFYVTRI